jgi:hypothetical protein
MRLELQIPDDLADDLVKFKPRTLSLPMFCAYLLELGVDRDVTLAERPKGSEASTSSSSIIKEEYLSINNKNGEKKNNENQDKPVKTGKSRKRPAYSEEFEQLWKLYQSAPERVSAQTKPKAFDEWKSIVGLEGPETLLQAVQRAIEEQKRRKTAGEFVGSLPDLFRWLRDGKYEVYLEEHKTQVAGRQWSADLGCWIEND